MIRVLLLFFLAAGAGLFSYVYFHLGGHKEVEVEFQSIPQIHLFFKDHTGPYHKINDQLEAFEDQLSKKGIFCEKTFGEFLDDPNFVDEDRLRSQIGCVVSEKARQTYLGDEFQYRRIPSQKVVFAKFDGSPSIGPLKVYPKARQFAADQRVQIVDSVFEIYTILRDNTVVTEYIFFIK